MLGSLLTTKLNFPHARTVLVPRPRLVEQLQRGIQGPLTLISAPAGSGKTTLLAEWRAGPGARVPLAWLSLDRDDNDPDRFLHHLAASLDTLQPGLLAGILPLFQSPEALRPETVLTLLINGLDGLPHDFLLILDDYHVIETGSIQAGMAFLLDHLPARMHLVLLTRADPPLPLSRLRARGHLSEIRAEHLSFDLDEAARFLNRVMGLTVTASQLAALEKRTEGWIAGLQLAALSMQGREDVDGFVSAFTGGNHYIVDYLGEEVLARQPDPLRKFLLETSILDRLTGPLCDAVTGGENGSAILEGLDHANLFMIPLDGERRWYRYHHLFADLLRSRLAQSGPEAVARLHGHASLWLEENGFLDEAIDHALAAGDFPNAARLICSDSIHGSYNCSVTALERWLHAFPDPFMKADPRLCIARAHVFLLAGHSDQIAPWIARAQEALDARAAADPGSASDPGYLTLLGETYAFRSLLAQADPVEAADLARKAVELVPGNTRNRAFALRCLYKAYMLSDEIDRVIEVSDETVDLAEFFNYPSTIVTAAYALCMFLRAKGRLHEAERKARDVLEHAEQRGQAGLFFYGHIHTAQAEIHYERNELEEMEACLDRGLALIRQGGPSTLLVNGLFAYAKLHLARADSPRVLETLAVIERECGQMEPEIVRAAVRNMRLNCQVARGDLSGLAGWVEKVDLNVERKMDLGRFLNAREAARFLLLLDRVKEARPIIHILEAYAEQAGHASLWISALILQALAWKKEKETAKALAVLEKALALAQPEGHLRLFLNEGPEMMELVQFARQRGMLPDFTTRLLSAFAAVPAAPNAGLLSKRETELLGLMASGCSNKEIAARLVISLGTVKRHAINIYTKLEVNNRDEAVARARQLGLL